MENGRDNEIVRIYSEASKWYSEGQGGVVTKNEVVR